MAGPADGVMDLLERADGDLYDRRSKLRSAQERVVDLTVPRQDRGRGPA